MGAEPMEIVPMDAEPILSAARKANGTILTVEDKPAIRGAQPLRPRGIQRLEFRRVR